MSTELKSGLKSLAVSVHAMSVLAERDHGLFPCYVPLTYCDVRDLGALKSGDRELCRDASFAFMILTHMRLNVLRRKVGMCLQP